jgi:hypothetical protein
MAAIEALIMAAKNRGPLLHARVGINCQAKPKRRPQGTEAAAGGACLTVTAKHSAIQ